MPDPVSRLNAALEGRYRLERELGEGGMATVFLAADLRHQRRVALKVLNPDLTAVVAHQRFLGEIRTTANLHHPHILPLFDSGEADGFLYYVMPYVEGESLRARLEREGELPIEEAVRIATDLAGALDYAHRHGVIHRDIKPGNILLHDGHPVLSDFGISLAVDAAGGNRLTRTGQSVGTLYYMSPEQAVPSREVDGRADMYSLACVLHEMLTGEPAFSGPSPRAVLAKHLTVPPIPVRTLRPRVPRSVELAILRALEKTPADRFSSMGEFGVALERGVTSTVSPRTAWVALKDWATSHPFALAAAGLALAGTAAISAAFFGRGEAWIDRPQSVVVLTFRESASTGEESALASDLADAITRELQSWDGLRVVTEIDLAGPREDLGLSEPTLERTGDGIALASAVDAQAMVALTVRQRGDSVSMQASVFNSRSRRRVEDPITADALVEEVRDVELVAPVVASVLGFGDAPEPRLALRAGTANPDAAEAYLLGRESLERNRLDEAEAQFAQAIQLDSTFASALSFLGQSYFWRGVEADNLVAPGPDISRWSTAAMRHVDGLSVQSESHVRGFYALQLGDYQEARSRYAAILRADPTDAYALLMLGEIELHDRWSVRDADGNLVPRSNLNEARRASSAAVRMQPTFELAYGRILAIEGQLEGTLNGACDGFEEAGDEVRPIWRNSVPSDRMYPLCAVAMDSLVWIPYSEFTSGDRAAFRNGADRLFRQAVGELERWATFAPEQPGPLEMLSDAYLVQRRQLAVAPPGRHRALAAEALRYASQALALQADTAPADLVRLANLQLAVGETRRAVEYARTALPYYSASGTGAAVTPKTAALINVLVASGQTSAALAMASGLGSFQYLPDPESGAQIPVAGGVEISERLRVLGASGVRGSLLRGELERLNSTWAAEGYSARWQQLLRNFETPWIAASLAFDSTLLADWSRSVTQGDASWLALSLADADPTRAAQELTRAVDGLTGIEPTRTFVLAATAEKLGRHAQAIELYSRLDSLPYLIEQYDVGWGLQVLSHLLRAKHYEQLGDVSAAAEHLNGFIEAKLWPDSLSRPLLEQAEESLARLERN